METCQKMSFKLFVSKQCSSCMAAREKLKGKDYKIYDIGGVDGLTEASYYGILSTPTLIETNEADDEVQRWGSETFK